MARVHIYAARRGLLGRKQYRARVVAANGKTLFVSAEGYNNRKELLKVVADLFPGLPVDGLPRDEGDVL
jgi:uncharacterized protein YegP (UPF0339 family)